ncbi:transporter [Belliella marina]|uniref:Transporter n=1 Tax=Belliella marina TaxID=1644146 RepID=A0ABW4VMH9_9BACT
MKKILPIILGLVMSFFIQFKSKAQTPWDEVMMGKNEICIALIYEHSTWDKYWEGTRLRENANIGTLTRQMGMPMIALGLTNKVNIIASLPYIATKASGGTQVGQSGIQDLSVSAKVEWLQKRISGGRLLFLTNLHYSRPVGNYLSDYMPFSLGFGAPELGFRGIAGYKMDNGLVFRSSIAYLKRGQTEIERNYYYQNGSVYSQFMNVPDAFNFHAAIGYWFLENQLRLEATYQLLNCLSGDDIRAYNAPQPTNKMEVSQVGAWAQYYIKGRQGLGVLAYYNYAVGGRNMGQFSSLGLGLTYQLELTKK